MDKNKTFQNILKLNTSFLSEDKTKDLIITNAIVTRICLITIVCNKKMTSYENNNTRTILSDDIKQKPQRDNINKSTRIKFIDR